jgi:hypothetical protein
VGDTTSAATETETVAAPSDSTTTTEAAAPVEYTLALPAGAVLDAAALERTVAIARERGLSNEAAQAVLELANTEATAQRDALLAAYQPGGTEHAKQVEAWQAETLADATLGATPEARQAAISKGIAVLDKFQTANPTMGAAVKSFLNDTGFGSKREVVHFIAWLGEAASEGRVTPAPDLPPAPPDIPSRMYGPNGPKQ